LTQWESWFQDIQSPISSRVQQCHLSCDPAPDRVADDGARFQLLRDTGHLPQIETPEQLLDVVWAFAQSHAIMRPTS